MRYQFHKKKNKNKLNVELKVEMTFKNF